LKKYKIFLKYKDGTNGIVDLSNIVNKGIFKKLQDEKNFLKVHVDKRSGALSWGNGLEICADALYMKIVRKSPDEVFEKKISSNA